VFLDYLKHLPAESQDRENVESKNILVLLVFMMLLLIFIDEFIRIEI